MKKFSEYPLRTRFGIVVGWLLVAAGLVAFAVQSSDFDVWALVAQWLTSLVNIAFPVAIIALGIYLIWLYREGRFDNVHDHAGSLHRSSEDRRLAGVCGGVAEYYRVDSTAVRICVLLLFCACPPLMAFIYVMVALILPRE